MINKYITATILALASCNSVNAQFARPLPRIVVNITIDQLRTDYIETFLPYYSENGFKKLFSNGTVYDNVQYTFSPVDRASAIASIVTGTTPYYNGITGERWLNKKTLIPVGCVDDNDYNGILTNDKASPKNIATTTINDELKIATNGKAIVYSIAKDKDAAIINGGHSADGAFWISKQNKCWCSSNYYFKKAPKWLEAYNVMYITDITDENTNANITNMALQCINSNGMGLDEIPDMLSITYDAQPPLDKDKGSRQLQNIYIQLDREIEKIISKVEEKVGVSNVMFIVTGTGYCNEKEVDYSLYNIPTGTFYINRTSNLLNMYLSAIYGQDKYVESCFYNQIFLNLKQIEMKHISMSEIMSRSQLFLIQNAGVRNAYTSKNMLLVGDNANSKLRNWYNPNNCGDLIVEVAPGWKLLNEDNQQHYTSRESLTTFPLIIYGVGYNAKEITTPITIDQIAPTIAKAIRIRAPNACTSTALH
ncbi:MAG: alkaline phosphatase family protein [Prevotellaceae bacterium]|nr:alkaline phosphatase family protein [Prevotellaceae bacterium]